MQMPKKHNFSKGLAREWSKGLIDIFDRQLFKPSLYWISHPTIRVGLFPICITLVLSHLRVFSWYIFLCFSCSEGKMKMANELRP